MKASGFAVVEDGEIDVRTVSSSKVAAMVNFLVVARDVVPTARMDDEDVEELWEHRRDDAQLVEVEIGVKGW